MTNTSKSFALTLILIFNVLALTIMPISKAQTYNEVNGIISTDITLTRANGPYQFGQVVVNSGATLTIEAGSTVNIDSYLDVSGTLIANGSSSNRIYFSGGSITFKSTSTANCLVENANLFQTHVYISGKVTITNSFLQGSQATTTLTIYSDSPTITYNTIKGTLDTQSVVDISGGSPIISNNNIISYVDNGLYPNPPSGMNRFGSAYGVHASNVSGAAITNNKFYLPFRTASVQVDSGAATVEGNTEYPLESIAYPTPTPPLPTPTPTPSPTLPPYPLPSSTEPTPIPTPTVPEFSILGILPLFIAISFVATILLRRKTL
jgi:hypothetical protein